MSNDTQVLRATLETALARIKDMLADDDGQAFKEARKFLESARQLSEQPGFVEWLKTREADSYSCSLLVRDALARLTAPPTAPSTEASEPVGDGTLCGHCDGSGTVLAVTGHLGPDDYEYEAQCEACWGTGSSDLRDAINALSYQPHSVTPGRQMVHRADVLRIIAARTTPPPAPLSDAEIDAITVAQWGDRVVTAAYRAYARAIEQAIGRAGRGAK